MAAKLGTCRQFHATAGTFGGRQGSTALLAEACFARIGAAALGAGIAGITAAWTSCPADILDNRRSGCRICRPLNCPTSVQTIPFFALLHLIDLTQKTLPAYRSGAFQSVCCACSLLPSTASFCSSSSFPCLEPLPRKGNRRCASHAPNPKSSERRQVVRNRLSGP